MKSNTAIAIGAYLFTALALIVGVVAIAQGPIKSYFGCVRGAGQAAVDACSHVIASGTARGRNVEWAYIVRGNRHLSLRQYGPAVDDYNAVVRESGGPAVYFPTEYLHGLYDGGLGSGLISIGNAFLQAGQRVSG